MSKCKLIHKNSRQLWHWNCIFRISLAERSCLTSLKPVGIGAYFQPAHCPFGVQERGAFYRGQFVIWPHVLIITHVITWLAPRAGKMNQTARCDWLPERARWLHLARCIPQAKFHQKPYNKFFIDHVCSVKMAGYWPRSFLASLWTSTSSRSINTQKKNLVNIQPSWPHTWSITHTYCPVASIGSDSSVTLSYFFALLFISSFFQKLLIDHTCRVIVQTQSYT